jgi:hypothetical protein
MVTTFANAMVPATVGVGSGVSVGDADVTATLDAGGDSDVVAEPPQAASASTVSSTSTMQENV